MAQTVLLKRSSVAGNVPGSSDLALGEIAVNTADGAVYIKKGNNDIVAVADNDILHIDTTNSRVGIGTTSPSKTLHVNGSMKAFSFEASGSGNKVITIGSSNDGTYYNGLIVWNQYNTSQPAHRLTASSSGGSHYEYGRGLLSFIENQGSNVTRMVIKQGNVGIGTATPDQKFHVEFANTDTSFSGGSDGAWGSDGIRIENTSTTANTMAMLHLRNYDADIHIAGIRQAANDSDLGFFFEGSEKMRITSDGKVGIGTTSPSNRLHINQSGNTIPLLVQTNDHVGIAVKGGNSHDRYVSFQQTNGSVGAKIGWDHSSQVLKLNAVDTFGSTHLTVDVNGNVGIGTTSIDEKLHVQRSVNNDDVAIKIQNTYDDNLSTSRPAAALLFQAASTNAHLRVYGAPADTAANHQIDLGSTASGSFITLSPSNSEAMRIDSSGNVGIGTTHADSKLDVTGGDITVNTTGTGFMNFKYSNSSKGTIGTDGIDLKITAAADLQLLPTGNVGIGTSSPSANLAIVDGGSLTNTDGNNRLMIDTSGHSYIMLNSPDGYDQGIHFRNNTDGTMVGRIAYAHRTGGDSLLFRVAGSDRLGINSSGAVTFNSAYTFPTADGSANQVLQTDGSGNLSFGTAAGGGVSISNNVNNRVLTGDGTNANAEANLTFDGTNLTTTGAYIADTHFRSSDGNATLSATGSGAVYLRPNGYNSTTAQFIVEATTGNVTAAGDIYLADTKGVYLGAGNDLQLYHNGSHSLITNQTGDLYIRQQTNDGDIIFQADDGAGGDTEYFRLDGGDSVTKISKTMLHFDNVKASFGNSEDMRIKHSGTDASIDNYTGGLYITNYTDDQDIIFRSDDGSGGVTNYIQIDGSEGRTLFNKHIRVNDNVQVQVGSSADLQILHDASDSFLINNTGDLYIRNNTDDKDILIQTDNGSGSLATYAMADGSLGSFKLFHYGSKKLETKSDGVDITGELQSDSLDVDGNADISGNLVLGGNLTVNGTSTTLNTATLDVEDKNITLNKGSGDTSGSADGAGITIQDAVDASNDATILWDASNDKFTFSHAISPTNILISDNNKIRLGNSQDLEIYHDGSASYIDDTGTGPLYLKGNTITAVNLSDVAMFTAIGGNKVGLNYNGNEKLATTSTGIDVTGTVEGDGLIINGGATSPTHLINGSRAGTLVSIDNESTSTSNGLLLNTASTNANSNILQVTSNDLNRFKVSGNGDISFYEDTGTTQALFWDASAERLGIGTTSPLKTLVVNFNSSDTNVGGNALSGGGSGAGLQIKNTNTTAGVYANLDFRANNADGRILYKYNSVNDGDFHFITDNNDSIETKMIIKNGGNVGIGTTSPLATLHVGSASGSLNSSAELFIPSGDALMRTLKIGHGSSTASITTDDSSKPITFTAGGSEKVRIDTSGRVGIKNSSPGSQYFNTLVVGDTSGEHGITIQSSATSRGVLAFSDTDAATAGRYDGYIAYNHNSTYMSFHTNTGNEQMRIDSSGKVGIGTTPGAKFQVNSSTTIGWSNLANAFILAGTTSAGIGIDNNEIMAKGGGNLYFGTGGSNEDVIIRAGGTTAAMTISGSNQRVGIAKSTPLARFQVEEYGIDTTGTSSSSTTQLAIHSFPSTSFRSARFTVQVTNSTDSTYHTTELLMVHDGTTANITEFGEIHTGSAVEATFDADISSGNVRLLATPASTDTMAFKVVCHSITT